MITENDHKFGSTFSAVAKGSSVKLTRIPYRAPRANAICERFMGSVRRECLDHVLIVNDRQLHRVIKEYVAFFNGARPHQGLGQQIPGQLGAVRDERRVGKIIAFPILNGLHHDYRRVATPLGCGDGAGMVFFVLHRVDLNAAHLIQCVVARELRACRSMPGSPLLEGLLFSQQEIKVTFKTCRGKSARTNLSCSQRQLDVHA